MTAETNSSLPIIGAAMEMATLPRHIDWLADKQRPLEIQDPCLEGVLDGDYKPAVAEARALLNRHGYSGRMGIHAAYSGLEFYTYDPLIKEVIAKRHRQSLEFGAELGATHMVLHSPFTCFGNAFTNNMPRSRRLRHIDLVHEILTPLLPMAERIGCAFVFEVCYDMNVVPLLDLVRSFDAPQVRLSIDTGHAFVNLQNGGPTPDQWVYEGADVLEHVHLQDVDGYADRHWTIGMGNINWRAFFHALAETQLNPRLIIETEDIRTSWEWLVDQKLGQQVQDPHSSSYGTIRIRLPGQQGMVFPVVYCPDEASLLVGSGDWFGGSPAKRLTLWNVDEASPDQGTIIYAFEGLQFYPRAFAFTPDGHYILVGTHRLVR